jgi:hypothetical protein
LLAQRWAGVGIRGFLQSTGGLREVADHLDHQGARLRFVAIPEQRECFRLNRQTVLRQTQAFRAGEDQVEHGQSSLTPGEPILFRFGRIGLLRARLRGLRFGELRCAQRCQSDSRKKNVRETGASGSDWKRNQGHGIPSRGTVQARPSGWSTG